MLTLAGLERLGGRREAGWFEGAGDGPAGHLPAASGHGLALVLEGTGRPGLAPGAGSYGLLRGRRRPGLLRERERGDEE